MFQIQMMAAVPLISNQLVVVAAAVVKVVHNLLVVSLTQQQKIAHLTVVK